MTTLTRNDVRLIREVVASGKEDIARLEDEIRKIKKAISVSVMAEKFDQTPNVIYRCLSGRTFK